MYLKFLQFLVGALILIHSAESKCEKTNQINSKTFKIDLDKPARERFKEPAVYFKEPVLKWYELEKKKLNFKFFPLFELIATELDVFFPYPFNEEIKGMAQGLDIPVGDIVIANFIYEITAYCTSIVAQQKNGQIIHGRNFDYDFPGFLQNLTYIAQFYRNGSLLFTSAQLAGYIGVVTGHKYKSFTFSINERDQGDWWMNLISGLLDRKAKPLSFLSRELMENRTSFEDAVKYLSSTDLIAPVYFIVGGVKTNEGAVITRNQLEAIDIWRLNASSSGIEKWYLLETNYDHWVPPPANDDRRTPGMKAMNATTQANINYETMMDVLTLNPICNKETSYSVVMSAIDENGFQIIIH